MLLGVIGCAVVDHDLRLIVLAAAVCVFSCHTSVLLLSRVASEGARTRPLWIAVAGLAFGAGMWTTHFIAMLAFHAGMPVAFNTEITLASLALAICVSFAAFALLLETRSAPLGLVSAGLLLAGGMAGMHYIGMTAIVLPGLLHFAAGGVIASVAMAAVLSVAGLFMFVRGYLAAVALLLALAICSLHFTGMASLRIEAASLHTDLVSLPPVLLALAAAAAGLLVLALSLTGSVLDQRFGSSDPSEAPRWREPAQARFEGILFEADGVITDANAAVGALSGRAPETFLGAELEALFDPGTAQRLREPEPEDGPGSVEGELLCSDGSTKSIEVARRPIGGPGRRVVLAVRDLSELTASEPDDDDTSEGEADVLGPPQRAVALS